MIRSEKRKTLTPALTARMLCAMQTHPKTLIELVDLSGLSKPTVTRYVNALHSLKMAHVAGWVRDARGYPTIRQFAWGEKPDMECPVTERTSTTRMRLLRAARKAGEA
jgi:DNA-binding IclR family transcriptional regulator